MTVALLVVGVLASLLKGFDYEEAILCAVVLAALLPCRRQFFRSASLMDEPFSVEWVVAILLVMIGIGWLLLFSYRHVEYSRDLWWQFELSSDAPRSLRATVGAMALLAGWGAWRLMRPATPLLTAPTAGDMADVAGLLAGSPRASACLALLGDKHFLFDAHHSGFVMYGIAGRSWIALGDPVAPPDVARNLVWRFRELSDRHGGWTVFYEVGPEHLPLYLDVGLELRKLGEKARVYLDAFRLEGGARKALRIAHRRAERDGLRFEVVPAEGVDAILPELHAVSNAWLAQKQTREKGFSLGCFDPNYLRQLPVAVVRRDGAVVAFANLLAGADHQEIACDLMRYRPGTHPSLMEFLFVELLVWSKAAGWQWFDLGMAPFSGLDNRALAPLWSRFGALVLQARRELLQLPGATSLQGEVPPGMGTALPRVARGRRATPCAGERRDARLRRTPWAGRAVMRRLGQALVLLLVWSTASSAQQILYYEPFGEVSVFRPTSAPRHVAIVISGDAGLDPTARTIAEHLALGATLVLGVDLRHYRERIAAGWADEVYPSADLELLSQFAQRALHVAAYDSPVLVGFDAGAALVYAALAEANPDTFLGAVSMGFCPRLALPKRPGHGRNLDVASVDDGVFHLVPSPHVQGRWVVIQDAYETRCPISVVQAFVEARAAREAARGIPLGSRPR